MAAKAKQAALKKLKAKPPVSEEVLAERKAAAEAREAAKAKAREEKRAAAEKVKADAEAKRVAEAKAKAEAEAEAAANAPPELTEEEKKAIRDARYAARKQRKKKKR
ncbi:hypothetical protein GCM10023115_23150 [Pontixanthobacter gangjinensis]